MADESDEQSWRPISLALAALAAVGWLAAGFVWWQGGQTQSYLTEQLTAAERARESLASDLQNLRKDGRRRRRPEKAGGRRREGAVGRLDRKGVGAERARRPDQADRRRQTRHFRRPGRGERQDARFAGRRRRLKDESDHVAALQSQDQALSAEQTRLQGDADAARKALADAQSQTASAQKEFEALQGQINAATAELNALQAQIRAAKPATGTRARTRDAISPTTSSARLTGDCAARRRRV